MNVSVRSIQPCRVDATYQLDLHESFIAIIEEITRLSTVDADDTEKQLTRQPKRQRSLIGIDNIVHVFFNVCLETIAFGQLALDVCCKPDLGQRASLLQEGFRIEHGDRLRL